MNKQYTFLNNVLHVYFNVVFCYLTQNKINIIYHWRTLNFSYIHCNTNKDKNFNTINVNVLTVNLYFDFV